MLKRWITAFIGIPITIWLSVTSFGNGLPFFFLVLTTALIINIELMLLTKTKNLSYPVVLFSILTTISLLLHYLISINIISITYLVICQFALFFLTFYYVISKELFFAHDFSKNFESIGIILTAYITLVFFMPQVLILKFVVPNTVALIMLFAFSWISDAAGLFTGMAFGRHKLSMLPSKSKTLEGYIGSIIFSIFLGLLLFSLQGILRFPFYWSALKWGLFGFMMSLSSNFGDLTESLIKRWAGAKDSSNLIPGMGGMFDSIDSIIYSAPIVWLFFSL